MLNGNENNYENNFTSEDAFALTPYQYQWPVMQERNAIDAPVTKLKMNGITRKIATIMACAVFFFSAAFCGTVLGNNISASNGIATEDSSSSVIYQSVIRTSTTGETVDGALSISEITNLASDSVIEITTETVVNGMRMGQYVSEGAGSGVIITTDGYIVTNNHVIDGAGKISIRLSNGESYEATIVGKDVQTDLAVIKIAADNLTPAVLGNSSALQVGETAVAIGNPLGELGGTVTNAIISALDREINIDGGTMTLLQTNRIQYRYGLIPCAGC